MKMHSENDEAIWSNSNDSDWRDWITNATATNRRIKKENKQKNTSHKIERNITIVEILHHKNPNKTFIQICMQMAQMIINELFVPVLVISTNEIQ